MRHTEPRVTATASVWTQSTAGGRSILRTGGPVLAEGGGIPHPLSPLPRAIRSSMPRHRPKPTAEPRNQGTWSASPTSVGYLVGVVDGGLSQLGANDKNCMRWRTRSRRVIARPAILAQLGWLYASQVHSRRDSFLPGCLISTKPIAVSLAIQPRAPARAASGPATPDIAADVWIGSVVENLVRSLTILGRHRDCGYARKTAR
jgi:hypothetical protein